MPVSVASLPVSLFPVVKERDLLSSSVNVPADSACVNWPLTGREDEVVNGVTKGTVCRGESDRGVIDFQDLLKGPPGDYGDTGRGRLVSSAVGS